MTNKPRVSHFTAVDLIDSKQAKDNYPDRSHIAQLYPTPKTHEEEIQDNQSRQQSYRRRWPRYPHLNVALYGSAVFWLSIWYIQNLHAWWFGSGSYAIVMATVFFTFILGLVIASLLVVWINYVKKLLYYFSGSAGVFWAVYGFTLVILLGLWLSGGWVWEYTTVSWIPILVGSHFTILLISTWYTLRNGNNP